jgi:hypothetical protein
MDRYQRVQQIYRCTGKPDDLDGPSLPRTKKYTKLLIKYLDLKTLWQDYGVAGEAEVCFLGPQLLHPFLTLLVIAIHFNISTCRNL